MNMDRKQAISLFRYGVIAPLVTGTKDPAMSDKEFYHQATAKNYPDVAGNPRTVGASTIEKWYLAYKKQGFEGLLPLGRSDEGMSRKIDADLQERIHYLRRQYPHMTSAGIYRKLREDGSIHIGEVPQSTVERFVRQTVT